MSAKFWQCLKCGTVHDRTVLICPCIELGDLHSENDRLRAENERLRSALKVIHTWAKVDTLPEYADCRIPPCLTPTHVMKLCNEALGMEKPMIEDNRG